MTKFSLEFDSITKSLSVSRDGQILENIQFVEMFKAFTDRDEPEKFHLRVVQVSEDSNNDVIEQMTIMANEVEKTTYNGEIAEAIDKHFGVN